MRLFINLFCNLANVKPYIANNKYIYKLLSTCFAKKKNKIKKKKKRGKRKEKWFYSFELKQIESFYSKINC